MQNTVPSIIQTSREEKPKVKEPTGIFSWLTATVRMTLPTMRAFRFRWEWKKRSSQVSRQEYLHERFQDQGSDIGISVFQGLRDAEGNGKDDQAYRVIQGNHRQQHIRHRSFGFVLADYHQGGGRGGGRSDCAQGYSYGHRQQVRHDKVQGNQRRVHAQGGKAGLDDADHRSLFARLLQG